MPAEGTDACMHVDTAGARGGEQRRFNGCWPCTREGPQSARTQHQAPPASARPTPACPQGHPPTSATASAMSARLSRSGPPMLNSLAAGCRAWERDAGVGAERAGSVQPPPAACPLSLSSHPHCLWRSPPRPCTRCPCPNLHPTQPLTPPVLQLPLPEDERLHDAHNVAHPHRAPELVDVKGGGALRRQAGWGRGKSACACESTPARRAAKLAVVRRRWPGRFEGGGGGQGHTCGPRDASWSHRKGRQAGREGQGRHAAGAARHAFRVAAALFDE